jgi:hypothetical protein
MARKPSKHEKVHYRSHPATLTASTSMQRLKAPLARPSAGLFCQRADQLLHEGDMAGCKMWHRILNAIERLQAKAPAEGRTCIKQGRSRPRQI